MTLEKSKKIVKAVKKQSTLNEISGLTQKIDGIIQNFKELTKTPCVYIHSDIDYNHLGKIKILLQNNKFENLNVILTTPGGNIDSAYAIVKTLRNHCNNLNIYVPLRAKSAGTLICLGADNIYLSVVGELGPLDVQIFRNNGYKSSLEDFKVLEQIENNNKNVFDHQVLLLIQRGVKLETALQLANNYVSITSGRLYDQIDAQKLGECSRGLGISYQYGLKILTKFKKMEQESADNIMKYFVYGFPSHGFIVDELDDNISQLNITRVDIESPIEELANLLLSDFQLVQALDYINLYC